MSTRKFSFSEGEFYHVYNRGNSRQTIFIDAFDYQRFIKLLYLSNSTKSFKIHLLKGNIFQVDRGSQVVSIGAYCLMPNHFHLLITPQIEGGLSLFMQKLTTGYSMYFNSKYERTGGLFEGKFKAEHVHDDRYLQYLCAYIHLNPMKLYDPNWRDVAVRDAIEAKNFIRNYKYSSFNDYKGLSRNEGSVVDIPKFPINFQSPLHFEEKIFEWIEKTA